MRYPDEKRAFDLCNRILKENNEAVVGIREALAFEKLEEGDFIMKRGILFFYNMGKITTAARIAIIPLAWTLTRFVPPAFFVCLWLFVLSLIVAMIPAPSDKAMMRVIEKYREEAKRQMSEESQIRDTERLIVLHGYRKSGTMGLRRHVGRDVIYPFPTSFFYGERGNKRFLMIAKKSLLNGAPVDYEMIQLHEKEEAEAVRVTAQVDPQSEEVVELTLYTKHAPHGITLFVRNDYHYRDFANVVQGAAKC